MKRFLRSIFQIGALRDLLFFSASFLYIWKWIQPELIHCYQEPLFQTGADYIGPVLAVPGGFCDLAGSFLAQFYIFPWLGALIITLEIAGFALIIRPVVRRILNTGSAHALHLLAALLLLLLHTQYNHSPSVTMGLITASASFYLYMRTSIKNMPAKLLFMVLTTVIVYWLAGGFFLLFMACGLIYDCTYRTESWKRKLVFSIILLITAAAIPILTYISFYLGRPGDPFQHVIPRDPNLSIVIINWILLLLVPVLMIKVKAGQFLSGKNPRFEAMMMPLLRLFTGKNHRIIETALIAGLTAGGIWLTFNRDGNSFMQIEAGAERGDWETVLETAEKYRRPNELICFHTSRALFHTGHLLDRLFFYPQPYASDGLFLSESYAQKARIQRSDLFFELGHVNNALRWAHEAMSMHGETPRSLRRIADINILKRRKAYAGIALCRLGKSLFQKTWITGREQIIQNGFDCSQNPELLIVQKRMPVNDFIISAASPVNELKMLLENHPDNRMAFEYLMAQYLLNRQIGDLMNHLEDFRRFYGNRLPVHIEEAVLLYRTIGKDVGQTVSEYPVSAATKKRFYDYNKTLSAFQDNKSDAGAVLYRRHGNTLWFYLMFTRQNG
ncbi:hypothetical protein JW948_16695 [bacterium]|nr:hypothetical protein [bacterium]